MRSGRCITGRVAAAMAFPLPATALAAILLSGTALPVAAAPATAFEPALLPRPAMVRPGSGRLVVANGAAIAVPAGDAAAATAARLLVERVQRDRGIALVADRPTAPGARIRFRRDPAIAGDEAYRLTVDRTGVSIAASGDRGLLYGAMTLAQLLSPDGKNARHPDRATGRPVTLSAMTIEDRPRFVWRGLLVDVVRHFQPVGELRTIVDRMVEVKLNTLHLHLTDDQGWRFEVKRYPKLTEVGGWRTGPSAGEPPRQHVGGFYTQDELRELVAYAAARGITIVPEIDFPGHVQAVLAAYPELGVFGDRPVVSNEWGISPYILNPGPAGMAFVRNVLDELVTIFPGSFVHMGGDEAVKEQWQRSPAVQAQIRALGLKDEQALQSWMFEQFGRHLAARGRRLIGWDEILEGGIPPSASIMSWRGEKGAVEAAAAGHDVVLSPAPTLYLDSLQSSSAAEPPGRIAGRDAPDNTPAQVAGRLANVYAYDPLPAGIAADRRHHVLGAQGNNWAEYMATPYQVQHMLFPRAAAIAEMTWTPQNRRDFPGFLARLDPQIGRWRRSGVEVADSAFAVEYTLADSRAEALRTGRASLSMASQTGYGTIRYTVDGSVPTRRSRAYRATIGIPVGTVVRAAAFAPDGHALGGVRSFDATRAGLLRRDSAEMTACPRGALGLRVPLNSEQDTNAPAYNINLFDTCTAYPGARMDGITGFTVEVARLPRNYGLANEAGALRRHFNVTPHGELVVTAGCPVRPGPAQPAVPPEQARPPVLATFTLPDPAATPNRFTLSATIAPQQGERDLCFQFTSPLSEPYYTVGSVQLTAARR